MNNFPIAIDDSQLQGVLTMWLAKTGKTMNEGLLVVARAACQAFMQYTLPRENLKMQGKVENDVRRVYATVSQVFNDIQSKDEQAADAFWYFASIKRWAVAKKIMNADSPRFSGLPISTFDSGILHKRMRGNRGHVPKGVKPFFVVKERGKNSKLDQYIEQRVNNVGMAKAGWYEVWKALGNARGAPEWVTRKRKGKGTFGEATIVKSDSAPSIVLHNKVRHAKPSLEDRYENWINGVVSTRAYDYFFTALKKS